MLGFFDIFFAMGLVRIYGISNFMVIPDPNGMALHAVVVYGLYVDFFLEIPLILLCLLTLKGIPSSNYVHVTHLNSFYRIFFF